MFIYKIEIVKLFLKKIYFYLFFLKEKEFVI